MKRRDYYEVWDEKAKLEEIFQCKDIWQSYESYQEGTDSRVW